MSQSKEKESSSASSASASAPAPAATVPPVAVPMPAPVKQPFEVVVFTPEVQKAIDEVMAPSATEPLDRRDFSAVEYINQMFPTEQSLSDVDAAIAKLGLKVRRLDEDVVAAVRLQVDAGSKGRRELEQAKGSVRELFAKITDIKEKAEASERMVTEICKHIKSLDHGKKNLTQAIKTLKKLQMLTSGVDQLGRMLEQGKFAEAARKLEAVTQLSAEFVAYSKVKKIKELADAIARLREDASKRTFEEFTAAFDQRKPIAGLSDVCELVQALGEEKKKAFIAWFCDTRLEEYKRHFNPYAESSRLDFVEKRYTWFHAALQSFGEMFADVFPPDWLMAEKLAEEFCCVTRIALLELLKSTREGLNVTALVMALQRTIEFEQGLMNLFEPAEEEDAAADDEPPRDDESPAPGEDGEKAGAEKKVKIAPPPKKFKGIISTAFDPYMEIYIAQEDRNIKEMLDRSLKDEKWSVDEDATNKVLGSCTDIIFYMKTSMSRCVELSTAQPLLDLHLVIRRHIRAYGQALVAHLPAESSKASEKDIRAACLIVNTGEFCRSRLEQFQRTFQKRIVAKLREKVDFKPEMTDLKQGCTSRGVGLLSGILAAKVEPSLTEMSKMPWATLEAVVDTSPYVAAITEILESDVPVIRKWLTDCPGITAKHWSLFLDVFVTRFSVMHLEALYRCKRISEVGAQSLLLDVSCIRTLLSKLPVLGTPEASTAIVIEDPTLAGTSSSAAPVPAHSLQPGKTGELIRFAKFVDGALKKAEVLLKVILAPQETLAHTYRALIPTGNLETLNKIIDLKGISKAERQTIVDAFQQAVAAAGPQPSDQAAPPASGAAAPAATSAAAATSNPPVPQNSSQMNLLAALAPGAKTKAILTKMIPTLHSSTPTSGSSAGSPIPL